MNNPRFKLRDTEETPARKIALTKVDEIFAFPKKGSVIGWEHAPPEKGCPYLVYLHKEAVLRTSPVQEVRKIDKGIIIKTLNSVYYVEYLDMEYMASEVGAQIAPVTTVDANR